MLKLLLVRTIEKYRSRGGGRRLNVECNFEPSCSQYALDCLERYNLWQSLSLIINRLKRCNDPDLVHKKTDHVPCNLHDRREVLKS